MNILQFSQNLTEMMNSSASPFESCKFPNLIRTCITSMRSLKQKTHVFVYSLVLLSSDGEEEKAFEADLEIQIEHINTNLYRVKDKNIKIRLKEQGDIPCPPITIF